MARRLNRKRGKSKPGLGSRIRKWVLGVLLTVFGLVVVLPVTFVLVFRVVPPPFTPLMAIRLVEGEGMERARAPQVRPVDPVRGGGRKGVAAVAAGNPHAQRQELAVAVGRGGQRSGHPDSRWLRLHA